jgi:hypothetical protein
MEIRSTVGKMNRISTLGREGYLIICGRSQRSNCSIELQLRAGLQREKWQCVVCQSLQTIDSFDNLDWMSNLRTRVRS